MAKVSVPGPLVIASAGERKGDLPWDTNEASVVSRMTASDGSSSPLQPSHPELFVQSKIHYLLKQPCLFHDAGL